MVCEILEEAATKLVSTSINRFSPFGLRVSLLEQEKI
jgi:hypothetical protein